MVAERYRDAQIAIYTNRLAANELVFENSKEKKKGDYYVTYLKEQKYLQAQLDELQASDAATLFADTLAKNREDDAKSIEISEAKLADPELSEHDRKYYQDVLDRAYTRSSYSDEMYGLSMMYNSEEHAVTCAAEVKGQSLAKALGLQGSKQYKIYEIEGVFDPEIVGQIDESQIGDIAKQIKKSKEFKNIQATERLGNWGSGVTVTGLATGLIGGLTALGLGAYMVFSGNSSAAMETIAATGAVAEVGGVAVAGVGALMVKIAETKEAKLGKINLADYINVGAESTASASESEKEEM